MGIKPEKKFLVDFYGLFRHNECGCFCNKMLFIALNYRNGYVSVYNYIILFLYEL